IGFLTAMGLPATVPSCTGGSRAVILGSLTPGRGPLRLPRPAAMAPRRLVLKAGKNSASWASGDLWAGTKRQRYEDGDPARRRARDAYTHSRFRIARSEASTDPPDATRSPRRARPTAAGVGRPALDRAKAVDPVSG